MRALTVPFDSIIVEDFYNVSRISVGPDSASDPNTETGIKELAESIMRDGLMTDLIVADAAGGKFALVAGFRRHRAIELIRTLKVAGKMPKTARFDPDSIPVKVFEGSKEDAALLNFNENWQRRNLSRYETAHSMKGFKERGLTQQMIAKRTGLSQSYVSSLIRYMEDLHDRVLTAWRENHGACTNANLELLSKLPRAEQEDEWEKILKQKDWSERKPGKRGKGKKDGEGTTKGNGSLTRPTVIQIEAARDAVNTTRSLDASVKDAMLKVFDFVAGRSTEIPTVFSIKEYTERMAEENERNKKDAGLVRSALNYVLANPGSAKIVEDDFLKNHPQLKEMYDNMKSAELVKRGKAEKTT